MKPLPTLKRVAKMCLTHLPSKKPTPRGRPSKKQRPCRSKDCCPPTKSAGWPGAMCPGSPLRPHERHTAGAPYALAAAQAATPASTLSAPSYTARPVMTPSMQAATGASSSMSPTLATPPLAMTGCPKACAMRS